MDVAPRVVYHVCYNGNKYQSCLLLATCLCSCIFGRKDSSVIKYTAKNADHIKSLATFAISYARDKKIDRFRTDTLEDKLMRKEFNHYGQGGFVSVTYNGDNFTNKGLPDSCVIFEQVNFFGGIREIIYDFGVVQAKNPNSPGDLFVKVADRIYYRRRPIPMM